MQIKTVFFCLFVRSVCACFGLFAVYVRIFLVWPVFLVIQFSNLVYFPFDFIFSFDAVVFSLGEGFFLLFSCFQFKLQQPGCTLVDRTRLLHVTDLSGVVSPQLKMF